MQTRGVRAATELRGLWLHPGPVSTSIKPLLLRMLERTHPDPVLREAVLEELQRRTKFKEWYSGLWVCRSAASTGRATAPFGL